MLRSKFTVLCRMRVNASVCLHQRYLEQCLPQSLLQNVRHVAATRTVSHQNTPFSSMKWILLLIPTTTFGLGTWQVQRRKWKRQLIADLKARTSAAPCDLPLDLEELLQLEYCPVRVQGQFEHSRELYIGPRTLIADGDAASQSSLTTHKSGVQSGYLVVTPFHLSDREDLPKMAEAAGTEPVFLEAKAETTVPGGPIGGQTRVSLRDEHLSYLLTWYGLSATTAYMWYRLFIARKPLL